MRYGVMAILSQASRLIFLTITGRQPTFQEAIALLVMALPLTITVAVSHTAAHHRRLVSHPPSVGCLA